MGNAIGTLIKTISSWLMKSFELRRGTKGSSATCSSTATPTTMKRKLVPQRGCRVVKGLASSTVSALYDS